MKTKREGRFFCLLLVLPLCLMLAITPYKAKAASNSISFLVFSDDALGTLTVDGTFYADPDSKESLLNARDEIFALMRELDESVSTKRLEGTDSEQSLIYKFNNNIDADALIDGTVKKYPLDYHGYTMLRRAKEELFEQTNGFFDPTIFPLVTLWELNEGPWPSFWSNPPENLDSIPEKAHIQSVLEYCGIDKLTLYDEDGLYYVSKPDTRMQVDLGAQAKGYACDRAIEIMERHGIENGAIDLSGNIYVYGQVPIINNAVREKNEDGTFSPFYSGTYSGFRPFNSGIVNPFHNCSICDEDLLVRFKLHTTSAVTSGDYNRFKLYEGTKLTHIINPKTGYPMNVDPDTMKNTNGLTSATVYGLSSELCDVYATAIVLQGMEKGIEFCLEMGLKAVLVGTDATYANLTDFEVVPKEDGSSFGAWAIPKYNFKAVSEEYSFGEIKEPFHAWIPIVIIGGVFLGLLGIVYGLRAFNSKKIRISKDAQYEEKANEQLNQSSENKEEKTYEQLNQSSENKEE